jgi:hypothetical protein
LRVGDTWEETGPDGDRIFTWQLAIAARPTLLLSSIGRLGHDRDGNGGMEGRITVSYRFTRPGQDITLFSRTMTIEAAKDAPLPDQLFQQSIRRRSTRTTRPSRANSPGSEIDTGTRGA